MDREIELPAARGPWTAQLYQLFGAQPEREATDTLVLAGEDVPAVDDDDLQLALYLCYELHYSGLRGVEPRMEWSPDVLILRSELEDRFERSVRALVGPASPTDAAVGDELQRLVASDDGPPLSRYVQTQATVEQVCEHVVHRSAYQLKEADPHSWAIPRLSGPAKAALVEVQSDEYGGGRAEWMHSVLFANTMRGLGLDDRYGAYLDRLPGITLATVNLMSWCGLHRDLRGSLVGHLAAFEMTSSGPNRRYGDGLRRLGYGRDVTLFYDEHVEADAVHENIAAWDLADGLATADPALADDILFGARALLALEARWGEHLLGCWERQQSSLLPGCRDPSPDDQR
jgi:heme oxygenase-like protein